jgi:hypothetical protein
MFLFLIAVQLVALVLYFTVIPTAPLWLVMLPAIFAGALILVIGTVYAIAGYIIWRSMLA